MLLVGPLGVNQILRYARGLRKRRLDYAHLISYLQNGGHNAVVRPWVWVLCLFLGPVIGSLAYQWSSFVGVGSVLLPVGIV